MKKICVWTAMLSLVVVGQGVGQETEPAPKPAGKPAVKGIKVAPVKIKAVKVGKMAKPAIGKARLVPGMAGVRAGGFGMANAKASIGLSIITLSRTYPEVAKELNIDGEAKKKLDDAMAGFQATAKEARKNITVGQGAANGEKGKAQYAKMQEAIVEAGKKLDTQVEGILGKETYTRGKQLVYQRNGLQGSIRFAEFRKEMDITDAQLEKRAEDYKKVSSDFRTKMMEARKGGDKDAMKKISAEWREQAKKANEGFLTPEQQKKWENITGAKFEFKNNKNMIRNTDIRARKLQQPVKQQPQK